MTNSYGQLKEELQYLFQQYYGGQQKDENTAKLAFICDLSEYISFYMEPDEENND